MRRASPFRILGIACIAILATAAIRPGHAEGPKKDSVEINKSLDRLSALFQDRIVYPGHAIYPTELLESLLVIDKDATGATHAFYTGKVVPGTPDAKPEMTSNIVYQSVVDRGFSATANYLAFISASLDSDHMAEVIAEDVFRAKGKALTDPGQWEAAATLARRLNRTNRTFFYVQAVQYTTIKHRIYTKKNASAKFDGFGFGAGGKVFASNTDFSLNDMTILNYFPIDPNQTPPPGPTRTFTPAMIRTGPKAPAMIKKLDVFEPK
jgi:hypothetical protein